MRKKTPLEILTYRLLKYVEKVTNEFPKDRKHTLGQRIFDLTLTLFDKITNAVIDQTIREQSLIEFRSSLNKLEVLLILSNEIRCLQDEDFINLQEIVSEIGRQHNAWFKAVMKRTEARVSGNTENA